MEELQAQAGSPSNNELQIAMGTRSSLLLPPWTNNEQWLGLKTWPNICAFYILNFNQTCFYCVYVTDVSGSISASVSTDRNISGIEQEETEEQRVQ